MLGHFRAELEDRLRWERVSLGKEHSEAVRGIESKAGEFYRVGLKGSEKRAREAARSDGLLLDSYRRPDEFYRLKYSMLEERLEQVREIDGELAYEKMRRAVEKASQEKARQVERARLEWDMQETARQSRDRRGLLRSGGGVRAVKVILCVALFAAAAMAQSSTSYGIDTFAGLRVSGDGGPAVEAWLDNPRGVAVDLAGNLYIADSYNHRVRRVDATGTITTIAGTGERGFSGDGGPASQAQLSEPGGIALDVAGNVYIADTYNHRIRKVDAAGTITTIAGSGERGFSGDGGPASQAQLFAPFDVAADGLGNLYIVDSFNDRIRKVDATGTITTIAGTGEYGFGGDGGPASQAQLFYPRGVAVDGPGNVYIAAGSRIRKVDSTGTITTIAGRGGFFGGDGGPAVEAQFHYPSGMAVDVAGNLYIADTGNHRIRKVDATGTITTIAGRTFSGDGGPASQAQLSEPEGVAADRAGNVYIADSNNHRIRKVDATGTITTIAGTGESGFSGDGGPASQAQLFYPRGVAVDGLGNLYIVDSFNNRIRKVDATGTITTIAGTGEYGFGGDGGPASQAQFREPYGVAVDGLGNLYIGDSFNQRIRKVDLTGTITTIAGTGERGFGGDGGPASQAQLRAPEGVAVDEAGNLYIADTGNHRIRKVDLTGTITTIAGSGERGFAGDSGPAVEAALDLPVDAAVDRAGYVYIADWLNHVIRKLAPMTGPVTTVPVIPGGSGSFSISATTPSSLTVEWKEPENTGSAITDYDVRYREVGSGSDFIDAQHTGTARSATLTGLSPGTAYEVQVRATNAAGTGAWSQLGIVRTSPLPTGGQIYYFPHLAVGTSWQTTITYINFSSQEVTCRTDFLSDHGTPLMVSFAGLGTVDSRTDVLPPGGSVHQETDVDLNASLAPGWARATCSGPVQASLLYRLHNSEGAPTAEAGVNATAVPATRFVTFAEQGEDQFGTGVAYANPSAISVPVTFTARDGVGEVLASVVRTLSPGGHDAHGMSELFDLSSFTGSIEVTSTEPIVSLSINFEADPVFSSLPPGETIDIPGVMLAPADQAAFNDLFVGKRVLSPHPAYYTDFVSPGRFRETEGSDIWTGSYTYRNTGPNTGTVTFNYDDGDRCVASFTFVSTTAGTATYTCNDGESGESNWRLVEIPASAGAPDLVVQTPSVSDSNPNAGVKGGAKLDQFGGGRIDQFWGRAAEQK